MVKVGERVETTIDAWDFSLNVAKGTITYIDTKNINKNYLLPVQVELDEPYDDTGQRILRFSTRDIEVISK